MCMMTMNYNTFVVISYDIVLLYLVNAQVTGTFDVRGRSLWLGMSIRDVPVVGWCSKYRDWILIVE